MTTDAPIRTAAEGLAAATALLVEANAYVVEVLESLGAADDPPPETVYLHRVADALAAVAGVPPGTRPFSLGPDGRRRRRDVGAA